MQPLPAPTPAVSATPGVGLPSAIKLGHRVTVLPGVSNRLDAGSVWDHGPLGCPRDHLVGKRGEVTAIDPDTGRILVDDQIHDGQPRGKCTMREWFEPAELEVG